MVSKPDESKNIKLEYKTSSRRAPVALTKELSFHTQNNLYYKFELICSVIKLYVQDEFILDGSRHNLMLKFHFRSFIMAASKEQMQIGS